MSEQLTDEQAQQIKRSVVRNVTFLLAFAALLYLGFALTLSLYAGQNPSASGLIARTDTKVFIGGGVAILALTVGANRVMTHLLKREQLG